MLNLNCEKKTFINSTKRMLGVLATVGVLAFAVSACEKKGPIEKAGKAADQAIEDAGQKVEEAGDTVKKETSK